MVPFSSTTCGKLSGQKVFDLDINLWAAPARGSILLNPPVKKSSGKKVFDIIINLLCQREESLMFFFSSQIYLF
jgi:hypothetical protein